MKVLTIEETRRIEAAADASLLTYSQMMQKAGEAASQNLLRQIELDAESSILFLIGKGNNGGDGLVMARDLARHCQARIGLYLVGERDPNDELLSETRAAGLFVASAADDADLRLLRSLVNSADVIVDAIFGIGLRLPLRGIPARVLRAVKRSLAKGETIHDAGIVDPTKPAPQSKSRPYVYALDCPSGIDCDTGAADPNAVPADHTISFIAAKRGHFSFPAASLVGKLAISDIGIPADFAPLSEVKRGLTDASTAASLLPSRAVDGHKGSFGKALIVAGCGNFIGAIALAAEAAYRAGAGLVSVAAPAELVPVVAGSLREPTWLPLRAIDGAIAESACESVADAAATMDALLIGPGLGRHPSTADFLLRLLERDDLPPLILDADALNILSDIDGWHKRLPRECVITPHAGEMGRLTRMSIDEVSADRWRVAAESALRWNTTVVLKGAHTLIAARDGDLEVSPFKSDALGTAGTGDILAGLLCGLLASGMRGFDCARLGVYVHALAGTIAADKIGSGRSVIAGDVLASVGEAFARLEAI